MIEAVNSVLQNSSFVRSSSEQISTVDSYAANPERVQRTAPQAPYISPYIHVDVNYNTAVLQLRNGETGDVVDQFPSEARLQAAARQADRSSAQTEQQLQQATPQTQEESAQAFVQSTSTSSESNAITARQQQAFQAAAQSGNSNAGNVTVFA